jgi:hypothetical protein
MIRLQAARVALTMLLLVLTAEASGGEQTNLLPAQPVDAGSQLSVASGYQLSGNVAAQALGNPNQDTVEYGLALQSAAKAGTAAEGSASTQVPIDPAAGRWYRFQFRGLPQDGFTATNGLFMQAEFFGGADGSSAYDGKRKELYPIIQQARHDLTVNGDLHTGGAAVWRDYALDFYIPFPQVNRVKLSVGFSGGHGTAAPPHTAAVDNFYPPQRNRFRRGIPPLQIDTAGDAFFITDWSLTKLTTPAEMLQTAATSTTAATTQPSDSHLSLGQLLPIGGRWFYQPTAGQTQPPPQFDHTNAERLLWADGPTGPYESPFAGNTTAVLRKGDLNLVGELVTTDTPISDNVVIRFDATSMIIHTHGLPNHPTGAFPSRQTNPGYIQEQDSTYYLPLNPKVSPSHIATTPSGSNHALNMGPIGIAVNGVVFFNPFDAGMTDASNAMDRCCGHPDPDGQYHYHKYPICVNSPWADEGKAHSPLIGWAFDGFPIYGPYESADVMAKDLTGANALNAFNLHFDPQRGWHYHVTPGKFPYIIGGYWGTAEPRDQPHHHPGGPMGGRGGEDRNGPPRGQDGGMPPFPPPPFF